MNNDLQIARRATTRDISEIAEKAGIPEDALIPYGHDKAKLSLSILDRQTEARGGLILVTAISPTPAGEGKTTTSIGLADGLSRLGKRAVACLREPSLGPVFGIKGGAAGGGYAQAIPMEDINLHFTGDLHAVTAANNLLCALLDNHIQQGNELDIDSKSISFRRCMDMNDRQLRHIVCGLGNPQDGVPREDGFDITAASEVMAVLCMASSPNDLKSRLSRITVGYSRAGAPITAGDLQAGGAMAVLLKDALLPNLVQTLEGTPVLMHGGPFANIAHGCNSIIATKMSMKLADYTVTEAGFGADLGAEKFLDIKCRNADIWPNAVVLVATVRALKFHGGMPRGQLTTPDMEALTRGLANLDRHVHNLKELYGLPVVVCINRFDTDTDQELSLLRAHVDGLRVRSAVCNAWAEGGEGAEELASAVLDVFSENVLPMHPYDYAQLIQSKITSLATKVYGAGGVSFTAAALKKIRTLEEQGHVNLPVCMAKTQYSFSDDATKLGAPSGFTVTVRDVALCSGAGFIVCLCGDIMRMPGLPKTPAAMSIDMKQGEAHGLF
ncbi:MAG TPA: formate--tetrahydrofolate ligase [Clostridiales bacterium]|nr:formate--tetrahydrofolate ligase [Clostridiales bacterium]